MTYVVREIDLKFQFGATTTGQSQSFGGSGADQLTLTGLRVIAKITAVQDNTVRAAGTWAELRIYGMTLDQMNQLTVAGGVWQQVGSNAVAVMAGDAGSNKTTVFNGNIIEAFPDFSEVPQTAFVVTASPGQGIALKPVPPVSFQGPTSADAAFSTVAQNAGLNYQNNGVNAMLSSPYLPGTCMTQIAALGKAANCHTFIDGATNTLRVWPQNGNSGGDAVTISPDTGMIGYPSWEYAQIVVRTLFDPSVKLGGMISVSTNGLLPPAEGTWTVVYLDYTLASNMPDGPWEMLIKAVSATTGQAQPVIPQGQAHVEDLQLFDQQTNQELEPITH